MIVRWASVVLLAACAGKSEPAKAPDPEPPPLHLSPVEDLVPAAGLEWIVVARPRAIAERPELIPAIHAVLSEEKLDVLAKRNGGVDLRTAEELAVARYGETTLVLAHASIDPSRIEQAFAVRVPNPEGRALDRKGKEPIVRAWGDGVSGREQIAIFGVSVVGHEEGKLGPLRAAELFAQARLKRAQPALKGAALARAAEIARGAPLRFFAPGPFHGDVAKGLGGLLAASTAAVVAVAADTSRREGAITVTVALVGAWGDDAGAARERLAAAWNTLASSSLGRLAGVDKPIVAPATRLEKDALVLEATLDALALAKGVHYAVDAPMNEIMEDVRGRARAVDGGPP
jgi:hypothetical protein